MREHRGAEGVDQAQGNTQAGVEGEIIQTERLHAQHRTDDQVIDVGLHGGHQLDAHDIPAKTRDVMPTFQ